MPIAAERPPLSASPGVRTPLAVRLCNWIGDVVLSLPALELLQAHGYDLQLYGKGWAADLLAAYPWPVTTRQGSLGQRVRQIRALGAKRAIVFPNSFSSALEMRLAGLASAGYAKDGRSWLLSQHYRLPDKSAHALQGFWDLARHVVGSDAEAPSDIHMRVAPEADLKARHLMAVHGLKDFVCIAPFATGQMYQYSKKWPAFEACVQRMVSQGVQVVVCPGPGEETEAAQSYAQALCLPGVPLSVYTALLSHARLMVANDTGPAHMAAAVGTPLISILGPTPVAHWRPWGSQVQVISQWPAWPSADEVWLAVARSLGR